MDVAVIKHRLFCGKSVFEDEETLTSQADEK
jgi:hypothetical protein